MDKYIRVFTPKEEEYALLERLAEELTARSPTGKRYYVDETYFDFGQKWMWTTVLAEGGIFGSYQALCPRNQEDLINGVDPSEVANNVLSSSMCPDRIRG